MIRITQKQALILHRLIAEETGGSKKPPGRGAREAGDQPQSW